MSFPIQKIKSERFYLRQIRPNDVHSIYKIYSDFEVVKFLNIPAMTDLSHAENFIENILEGYLDGSLLEWVIDINEHKLIGTIRYNFWDHKHRRASIGFAINKKWWGGGIMSQLLSDFIPFGFKELNLNRIEAYVHPSNKICTKLLKKYGFQREGFLREHYLIEENFQDTIILGLLKNQ